MVQATYMGVYFDTLENKADGRRSMKLLSIATYVSDFVRIQTEPEHTAALCHEFLATADLRPFGLDPDLGTGQEIEIAKAVFVPIFEELTTCFPSMAILRPLIQVNIKQGIDPT
jgi:hypothetical protein